MQITDKKTICIYYQALLERNSNYVGTFYVGVKTTSVFCIATCRARKPKFKNVEFYSTFKDALNSGFRPCKVCKPTENTHEAPEPVIRAMKMVSNNLKEKITDFQFRQLKISPELLRRWFKKHYGMTFQTYQRMYRINNAYRELKGGKKTIDTAFDTGYESLSGFGYTFKKIIGNSPTNIINNNVILISRVTTPIGPMFVCASDDGICLLEFVDRRMLETEFKDLQKLLKAKIIAGENKHIKQVKKELNEYFLGQRKKFEVELHTPGTEFQNLVLQCLSEIPFGKTCTYEEQAEKIHKDITAVALANGYNRIAIIIPCHRVIEKSGNLTGYGGGLVRKRWLIEHEKKYSKF